jgi:hypothetical protein
MKIPALFSKFIGIALLGCAALAQAQDIPAKKYKLNFPPSAELRYAIQSQQKGLALDGEAVVRWTNSGKQFSVSSETRAMLIGKVLDTRSEGGIDEYGLAPTSFSEKRIRKEAASASFDRASKTISFSTSDAHYDIKGGEQDRSSVIWQLIAIARAAPAKFKPGTEWKFFVVGPRDADAWTFTVVDQQKLETPTGVLNTVHITRSPPNDSQDQKLDIWLAPSMEWYPARLRFSEQNEDFIEQTLVKINKKTP